MTCAEYRRVVKSLHWTPGRIAEALGCSRTLPVAWGSQRARVPPEVAEWLSALAAAHAAIPPPADWRVRADRWRR